MKTRRFTRDAGRLIASVLTADGMLAHRTEQELKGERMSNWRCGPGASLDTLQKVERALGQILPAVDPVRKWCPGGRRRAAGSEVVAGVSPRVGSRSSARRDR